MGMILENDPRVVRLFEAENGIWYFDYNGNPKAPHAELTGGLCSDGFINCRVVLSNPQHAQWLAVQLVRAAVARNVKFPDWVVGSLTLQSSSRMKWRGSWEPSMVLPRRIQRTRRG